MRVVLLLALLLAGCGAPDGEHDRASFRDDVVYLAPAMPNSFDGITDKLAPASAEFQDFLVDEDSVAVGSNGSMAFQTGRGMHCAGNVDAVAPNATGWVACMVRLKSDSTAQAQDVHELGIGYDVQRLSLRQASEPIEWRFVVTVVVDKNATVAHDSGWRPVDLSAVLGDPIVTVDVQDPCDVPDRAEEVQNIGRRGVAVLVVEFEATHGKPYVEVDLGPRSIPGDAESTPFAQHGTTEHGLLALYPTASSTRGLRLELHVDLEAPEAPGGGGSGPCSAPIGGEMQEWTVNVGITDSNGALEIKTRTVDVAVVLEAMPLI